MRWLSSYFVKMALLMTLLPMLVLAAALVTTYQSTSSQLRTETIHQINDEIAGLVEIYADQETSGLLRTIEYRQKLIPKSRARTHYAVVNNDGNIIGGTLSKDSVKSGDHARFVDLNIDQVPLILRSTPLRGGEVLFVARDDLIRQDTLRNLRKQYLIWGAAAFMLAMMMGLFAAWFLRRRIKNINDTCTAVGEGDLAARAAVGGADEIGVLSGNVNEMLGRISKLIALRKNISDQVAHELRSPLTRLDAKLVRAASATENPGAIQEARDEVNNCISLLDALLDVSSLEAQSGDKTGFEPVNISKLAVQMAEFYRATAEEAGMVIDEDIARGVIIEGDKIQLSRLIANLLENAIKYAASGKQVKISVGQNPSALLTVEDKGPGVPPEYAKSIFTPFFRHKGKQSVSGHGLGLALCQAIGQRHGFEIKLEDAAPGARFVVGKH